MIATTVFVWFFAVSASEQWWSHDKAPRNIGGWTHQGPYKTKAECEQARASYEARPIAYADDTHIVWHRPGGPCRQEDKAKTDALFKAEWDKIRAPR